MLGGVVIGWAPVAVALAADPRFRRSYVDVLLRNAGAGTNVPLPVPWPWSEAGSWSDALSLSFAGVATIAVAGLVVVVVRRRTIADSATLTVVAGAVVVGVPYLHHAFSRADAAHLAQVAAPALVVAWTLTCRAWASGGRVRPAAAATGLVVLAASCLVPLRGWPPGGAWVVHVDDRPLEPVDVRGETRLLRARDRQFLDAVTELSNELPSDARVAVVPRGADVYLHTERRPGIPQLYLGGPTNAQQRAELAELMTDVDWVLIEPGPYGGNPDTAFHLRYPEAWRTVVGRCERVPRLEDPRLPFEVRRCRA